MPREGIAPDREAEIVQVFRTFSSRWPKFFAATRVGELLPVWATALESLPMGMLPTAALSYCAHHEGKFAPEPGQFARFARGLVAKHTAASDPAAVEMPAPDSSKDGDRIERLSRWAYRQLGTWPLVAEVWALLADTAPDAARRQQLRDGTIDREVFRDAVNAVQNGRRVMRRGPMADELGAA